MQTNARVYPEVVTLPATFDVEKKIPPKTTAYAIPDATATTHIEPAIAENIDEVEVDTRPKIQEITELLKIEFKETTDEQQQIKTLLNNFSDLYNKIKNTIKESGEEKIVFDSLNCLI
jgi:hypothetical protein